MASSAQAGGGLSTLHIPNQITASHHTETCNVVIFGETGAGKSSLINLVAGTQTAPTSCDATGCTTETNVYNVLIQNKTLKVKLYDTVGLGEGPEGTVPDREARKFLKKLLRDLMKQIDIHLLMYCVRGVRATKALCRNYDLVLSEVKERVPIVLVATALEDQAPEMEEWWRKNEKLISNFGMAFAGHACVTTAYIDEYAEDSLRRRRKQSYHAVCQLIEQCRLSKGVQTPLSEVGRWFSTIRQVSTMTTRKMHKDIVLTDETAALMAEEEVVAPTAPDLRCWTLERTETADLDDEISRVFETIRLEHPHLGIKEHLIPPDIGARNNTNIRLTGEIAASNDSSVELMTGDGVATTAPDMQRRMPQCSDTVDLDEETSEAPETIENLHLGIREYPIPLDMGARNNDNNNNILLTGETAASDDSPVKLMAGDEVAHTAPDVRRRMLQRSETLDDQMFKAFLRLVDPRLRIRGYAIPPQMGARNNDKDIVLTGVRAASNVSPVNLVVTALDMQRRMLQHSETVYLDDKTFKAFLRLVDPRLRIRGYTVPPKMSARNKYKSILPFCRLEDLHLGIKGFPIPPDIGAMNKQKIFVLFWQTGAGKNSLVNMLAIAPTAPDMRHRMLQCTETVDSHDETSEAFRTARLEELHLGIIEYFIPPKVGVRNKHKISLLFWQTGADKSSLVNLLTREVVPTAPHMQRRMLQCSENINLDVNVKAFLRLEDPHLRIRGYHIPPEMNARNKHKIVSLFWQTGAGKSSLVNLMTRVEVAPTVPDVRRRMLQFSETIYLDDKAPKAFLNLEDPHLRIRGCLIPPKMGASTNKHKNIVPFSQTGAGKSSLINLIPAEEVAPTAPVMRRHMPQCSETLNTDDKTSKVFLRLEDPHPGTRGYPVPPKMSTRRNKHQNIVLFGDTGAGKSSLINLMAGKVVACTSPDMERCTMHWQKYNICFGDTSYKVFDTVGLEAPELGIKEYLEFVENAYQLIKQLDKQGGIDLLLFCVRAGRVTATLQNNYRLFHEFLCEKKVPIVLAITGLEREQRMEDYWERNQSIFMRYRIQIAGHACITAANRLDGRHKDLYEESRVTIRNLVEQFTADGQKQAWRGGDNLFVSLMRKLKELLVGSSRVRRRDLVPHLTKRCGMSREVAKHLADMIQQDVQAA